MLVETWSNDPSYMLVHKGLKTTKEMMEYMVKRAKQEKLYKERKFLENGMLIVFTNGVELRFTIANVV